MSALPPIPTAASRTLPGRSRQEVAKAMGVSVAEVARIETLALLKCRAACERRAMSLSDFLSLIYPTLP